MTHRGPFHPRPFCDSVIPVGQPSKEACPCLLRRVGEPGLGPSPATLPVWPWAEAPLPQFPLHGMRTLQVGIPRVSGALRASLPAQAPRERGLGGVCTAFRFHLRIDLCAETSACLFEGPQRGLMTA